MNDTVPVVLVILMVCSVFAPTVAATPETAHAAQSSTQDGDEVDYDALSDQLQSLAAARPAMVAETADTGQELSDEKREAAREGARAGAQVAQEQGVNITQAQIAATVNASIAAVSQNQNASVEQIQSAAKGAAHGALLQSQEANVTQVQAGVYGSIAGSLSQHQQANVTQLQAAAYGAAHGTVAQHQQVNITQMQYAAVGASAGAAHGAAQSQQVTVSQTQRVNVTQIQEAAQGGAYGALVQRQEVRVTQIQAAAFGAAGGGTSNGHASDPKKVQEASMGAAQGSLVQSQRASVNQIQSAARGACKGSLTQSQNVTIVQIQQASIGAAEGAITQYQSASVTQIQAAANGAARGTITQITQIQQINIVQIQQAAAGAASGAARSAAQNQIVNVQQIQAAAAGAGQGSIVQIQQVNIVQIQIIADSAASGALSQHQQASVVQIQSAARGASEGSIALTQRQEVTVEQLQTVTQRSAAETVAISVEINIENDVTIYNYARGSAEDPEEDDEDVRLRSLFASAEDDAIFLANPNDVSVTVTLTSEAGDVQTITLAPGESITESFDPGTYTLTAETGDGEDIELAGRESLTLSIGDELQSLEASVDAQTLTVENPNDVRVTVVVRQDGARVTSFDVPREWTVSQRLDPGEYTLTAQSQDGRTVPVNGEERHDITSRSATVDLSVSVDEQARTLTVENPTDTAVTVTVTPDEGDQVEFDVAAGATESRELDPGDYTLSGESEDDRPVNFDGPQRFEIPEEPEDIDLNVTVEDQTVTVENPGPVAVTVTVSPETGEDRRFAVPAGGSETRQVDPGTYAMTATADDERTVTVEGQDEYQFEIEPPDIDLNVIVDEQNVSVENPGEVAVTVTATDEAGDERTLDVSAGETVTERFDPGSYTLTAAAEDDRNVTLNGSEELEIEVEEPTEPEPVNLTVTVSDQNVSIENPSETAVTVTATDDAGDERTIDVPPGENVTELFEPGTYTLTGETDDERTVRLNGSEELTIEIAEPELPALDLDVTVGDQNVSVENPGDVDVTVTASPEDGEGRTFDVPAGENVTETFDPGNYTLTGEATDDRTVTLNDQQELEIEISEEPAEPIDLDVTVADQNVSVENLGDVGVTVTASPEEGADRTLDVSAGENVTEQLEPGNYTLTAEAEDDSPVTLNGQDQLEIEISEAPAPPTDLGVTVDEQNVSVENPGDVAVTVTATDETGETRTVRVAAAENVTEQFEPGNYTLTADAEDGRPVTLDGEDELDVEIEEPTEPIDLDVTVAEQNVSVENPGPVLVTVTATDETGEERTVTVPAGENVTEQFEPGNYTLTAQAEDDRNVTLNGEAQLAVEIEAAPLEPVDLTVTVADQNVSVENTDDVPVTVVASPEVGENVTFDVQSGENVTQQLEPGNYTLTGETEDERTVLLNGSEELAVNITEEPAEPVDLSVTVSDQTVSLDNPSEIPVTVTASPDVGEDQTFEVPAGENVTQQLEPGNYTLTGETDEDRPVTFDGEAERTITVEAAEIDRQIDSCRDITEPGLYELVDDVSAEEQDACLRVQASDVVIDGNGHLVEGTGATDSTVAGILVEQNDDETVENVTIRSVRATDWNAGIQVDDGGLGGPNDVAVEDSVVRNNGDGVVLTGQNAALTNVTVTENGGGLSANTANEITLTGVTVRDNQIGLTAVETTQLSLRSSVVQRNDGAGIQSGPSTPLMLADSNVSENGDTGLLLRGPGEHVLENVTVSWNDGHGIVDQSVNGETTVTQSAVENNSGVGVRFEDDTAGTITDSRVENNSADGIWVGGTATLRNVTARENEGLAFDAREGSASATELRIDTSVVSFDSQPVALDPVQQTELPELPDEATAVGPGLSVTGLDASLQATLLFDAETATDPVRLWRYDGAEWISVESDPATADGSLQQTISEDGVYAPVSAPEEEELRVNATVGNSVVYAENPTEQQLTVAVTNESGTVLTQPVAPGANESLAGLDPGQYTMTAETNDGEPVPVNGETQFQFTLPPDIDSLALTVSEDAVSVENPNDVPASVSVEDETGAATTLVVDPRSTGIIDASELGSGTYTASAETNDGRSVPINGEWALTFEFVAPTPTPTPTPTPAPTPTPTPMPTPDDTPTNSTGDASITPVVDLWESLVEAL